MWSDYDPSDMEEPQSDGTRILELLSLELASSFSSSFEALLYVIRSRRKAH